MAQVTNNGSRSSHVFTIQTKHVPLYVNVPLSATTQSKTSILALERYEHVAQLTELVKTHNLHFSENKIEIFRHSLRPDPIEDTLALEPFLWSVGDLQMYCAIRMLAIFYIYDLKYYDGTYTLWGNLQIPDADNQSMAQTYQRLQKSYLQDIWNRV